MRFQKNDLVKPWQLELFKRLAENEPRDTSEVTKTICVLSTPRSGSTYLCDMLNNTGQVGMIEEWFNYEYFYQWQQATNLDFTLEKYVKWVVQHTIGDTGVFGIHWHVAQVFNMIKDFNFGLSNFKFDKIIYIRRCDKVAQAVSHARSGKSNQFRHHEECKDYTLPNFAEIARSLYVLADHEEAYNAHLKDDSHLHLWYEDFQTSDSKMDEVMEFLGLERCDHYTTTMKRQRTANTRQLARDFRAYITGDTQCAQ